MKKLISLTLALLLALTAFVVPASAEEQNDKLQIKAGVLSLLNLNEEEYAELLNAKYSLAAYMSEQNIITSGGNFNMEGSVVFYDTIDAMLMGLEAGDVFWIELPKATADYLCSKNDKLRELGINTSGGNGISLDMEMIVNRMSNGYAFLMLDTKAELRDAFDKAIDDMQADGTMRTLTEEYIHNASEFETVTFDNQYEETITVAVTGALPPMDYIAADGSYAGFNTAVLAEIGKRIGKNIQLVQTDSIGRAAALSSGTADVVFWTRVSIDLNSPLPGESEETHAQHMKELEERKNSPDKVGAEALLEMMGLNNVDEYANMDMPMGTIVTDPYYTDYTISVALKQE